jgi:hypothetical protein
VRAKASRAYSSNGAGQAKKLQAESFISKNPFCVFCGGRRSATTVDHVPPIIMFAGRQRPKGLEFAACEVCNHGSRHADLFAAFLGRGFPDTGSAIDKEDISKILRGLQNNIPEVLIEMKMGRASEKLRMRELPTHLRDGGLLRLDGPIASKLLKLFAYKMGLALYFETTKRPLPKNGQIAVRVWSNFEKFTGDFPEKALDFLGKGKTLQQGKKEVNDQFSYATALSEDGKLGAFFASFRMAFALIAFVSEVDGALKETDALPGLTIKTPQQVRELILTLG